MEMQCVSGARRARYLHRYVNGENANGSVLRERGALTLSLPSSLLRNAKQHLLCLQIGTYSHNIHTT